MHNNFIFVKLYKLCDQLKKYLGLIALIVHTNEHSKFWHEQVRDLNFGRLKIGGKA